MVRVLRPSALLLLVGVGVASAKMDQAAGVEVGDLQKDRSSSSSCPDSDDLDMKTLAVTVRGQEALIGVIPARFDEAQNAIISEAYQNDTEGGHTISQYTDGNTTKLLYNVTQMVPDGYCVYELEVEAGELLGVKGESALKESGIVHVIGLDRHASTRSAEECQTQNMTGITNAAYVLAMDDDGDELEFMMGDWSGKLNNETKVGEVEKEGRGDNYDDKNRIRYLLEAHNRVHLATELDQSKSGPAGCAYELAVVDGTVLGVSNATTPAPPATNATTNSSSRAYPRRLRW